jgi:hypothetical protein
VRLRLVRAGLRAETNGDAIPSVDGRYRQGEIDQLLFGELAPRLFDYSVMKMRSNPRARTNQCRKFLNL